MLLFGRASLVAAYLAGGKGTPRHCVRPLFLQMGQRENMKTPNTAATSATGEPSEPSSTAAAGTGGTAGDIENENENKGDLSDVVGRVGRFSWTVLAYEVVAMFSMALHNLAHSQTSLSDKDHWCRLPDPPGNTTLDEWKSLNIPRHVVDAHTVSACTSRR